MSVTVLVAAGEANWHAYQHPLGQALANAGVDVRLVAEAPPEQVDYIVYAPGGLTDFSPYTNCRLVQSLWAGVERIVGDQTLTQPLARMVDPALTEGMVEYVTGHALRLHLGMDAHICGQDGRWRGASFPPLARERRIGILGLGELGAACALALRGLGFDVAGWSRTARTIEGISCLHGEEGLRQILSHSQILVTLLPATAQTENIINAEALARMPQGAMIINPGRGMLIDDEALLAALDSGRIAQATLDVFRTEPLPPQHPYWHHPRVTVTPHIAAATRPATASLVAAENIRRGVAGEPFLHLVDRGLGY